MKRPCCYPGCPTLLDKGTYCPPHAATRPKRHTVYDQHIRHRDPALAIAARIRSSSRWQKVRRQILADFPLCADPYGDHGRAGITITSTQVHHRIGLIQRPDLWNHRDNLQALCTACHARIEREARKSAADDPERSSRQPHGTQEQRPPGVGQKFTPFG